VYGIRESVSDGMKWQFEQGRLAPISLPLYPFSLEWLRCTGADVEVPNRDEVAGWREGRGTGRFAIAIVWGSWRIICLPALS